MRMVIQSARLEHKGVNLQRLFCLQDAVQLKKRQRRCRFCFSLCRCRNFTGASRRSSSFQLLHVAVSEPCRPSEFTLTGPHNTAVWRKVSRIKCKRQFKKEIWNLLLMFSFSTYKHTHIEKQLKKIYHLTLRYEIVKLILVDTHIKQGQLCPIRFHSLAFTSVSMSDRAPPTSTPGLNSLCKTQ